MAVNSGRSRTQDQLHIHVDRVDPRLRSALRANPPSRKNRKASICVRGPAATALDASAPRRLSENIFVMIASELPVVGADSYDETVAVVGYGQESGARSFVVLENDLGGHSEDLFDNDCRRPNSRAPVKFLVLPAN